MMVVVLVIVVFACFFSCLGSHISRLWVIVMKVQGFWVLRENPKVCPYVWVWFPINVFAMLELGFENYYFIESKNSLGSFHACWNCIFYFVCVCYLYFGMLNKCLYIIVPLLKSYMRPVSLTWRIWTWCLMLYNIWKLLILSMSAVNYTLYRANTFKVYVMVNYLIANGYWCHDIIL